MGNTYFFEGDDQTTIDGELAIHGTGSEDFYNGGWYDVPGRWEARRSYPLSGCLAYQKHLGRTGGYRPFISFQCELPASGRYQVKIDAVKGPEQGQVQLFVDEIPVGRTVDLYTEKREKALDLPLATLELEEGVNILLFKLVGKNTRSAGLGFDLTNIIYERE